MNALGFWIFLSTVVAVDAWLFEKGYKSIFHKRDKDEPQPRCEHGKDINGYCEPCGRINAG